MNETAPLKPNARVSVGPVTFANDAPQVPQHPDVLLVQRGLYPASLVGSAEASGIGVEQIRRIVLEELRGALRP